MVRILLLRAASRKVLPESVAERKKSPDPQTHTAYLQALIGQARELMSSGHPVFELIDQSKLEVVTKADATLPDAAGRQGLEQLLSLATWLGLYQPDLLAA